MALKKNNPGCLCCGPACQEAWNDLLARFTDYEISGLTVPTLSGALKTSFATNEGCGDGDTSNECKDDGINEAKEFVIEGVSCFSGSYFEGIWRASMGGSSGCASGYEVLSYAGFNLSAEVVSGTKRWQAEYFVKTKVRSSGPKVCNCDDTTYYLDDPYAAGLIYQNGSSVALYDSTDITLNLGDDLSYSWAANFKKSNNAQQVFDCTVPSNLAADDTPASGYYDYLVEYEYGAWRRIYTTNVNDLPLSVTLTPLLNPGNIDGTFDFS